MMQLCRDPSQQAQKDDAQRVRSYAGQPPAWAGRARTAASLWASLLQRPELASRKKKGPQKGPGARRLRASYSGQPEVTRPHSAYCPRLVDPCEERSARRRDAPTTASSPSGDGRAANVRSRPLKLPLPRMHDGIQASMPLQQASELLSAPQEAAQRCRESTAGRQSPSGLILPRRPEDELWTPLSPTYFSAATPSAPPALRPTSGPWSSRLRPSIFAASSSVTPLVCCRIAFAVSKSSSECSA